MPYRIRPWTASDAGIDRAISQSIYPEYREEPGHPAWFPATQLGAPREAPIRYVAVDAEENRPVAYASLWELRPRRYRFDLAVRPERQRQGIGAELLSQVTRDAEARGATGLQARVRDDKPEALAFVVRRDFREVHQMAAYRRDFAPPDGDVPMEAVAHLHRSGIEVKTLAEARSSDSSFTSLFYELYSAVREGWPDPDPDPAGLTVAPFDWVARQLAGVKAPEAFFLARHQDRYVGFSSMFGVGFGTAIHPAYRGRGIASALRTLVIADAQRRGLRGDTTSTANPAMQAVLEKLGYRRLWSEIRLIRAMASKQCS